MGNMWLDKEAGDKFGEKWRKLFTETLDYKRGYKDAIDGISTKMALRFYGSLTIRYYMGHRKGRENIGERNSKNG